MKRLIKETAKIIFAKQLFIFCIGILLLPSCRNKSQTKIEIKNNQEQLALTENDIGQIRQHIEYQKRIEYDENEQDNPYSMTEKDMVLASKVILEGLKSNGYKTISDEQFEEKINLFFGIKKLESLHYKSHVGNTYITLFGHQDKELNDLIKYEFEDFNSTYNYYLMRHDHVFTDIQYLNQLIKVNENNVYKINIPSYIIYENKYLFNDDKASLAWILNNDIIFYTNLLKTYGYDKEPKINKKVLDSIYKQNPKYPELIGPLFFVKDSYHNLQIREGLLKYVEENTTSTDNRFLYALGSFIDALYSNDDQHIFDEDPSKKFTELEKAKIVAYFTNLEIPAIEKYKKDQVIWSNTTSTLYYLAQEQPQMVELIKKNNYFGLPKLKIMIDETLKQIEVYNEHYHESNR